MTTLKLFRTGMLCTMFLALLSFDLPSGWYKAGSEPKNYEMGIDPGSGMNGKNAATIKSIVKKTEGFGTLMQTCSADSFLGKRVRMSGLVKTKDVTYWAGLWLRVDDKSSDKSLGFDNMKDGKEDRSIKGTTEWKKYEIVLDVPINSSNIAFGALLSGTGQIWFDELQFEIVDNSVPTTGRGESLYNKKPVNLDFEK